MCKQAANMSSMEPVQESQDPIEALIAAVRPGQQHSSDSEEEPHTFNSLEGRDALRKFKVVRWGCAFLKKEAEQQEEEVPSDDKEKEEEHCSRRFSLVKCNNKFKLNECSLEKTHNF